MPTDQIAELTEELRKFQEEKEKIRGVVGQIGGRSNRKRDKAVTLMFVVLLLMLFAADICRHVLNIPLPLPSLFSLEVGILLVSIKIIWMIHSHARVEHFQFWILNSIEFRIDQISNRLRDIEGKLGALPLGDCCAANPPPAFSSCPPPGESRN